MKEGKKIVTENRKARHDYFILETYVAGIVLKGTEVKSLRASHANLKDSYAGIESGEVFLFDCHINPYTHGNIENHDPLRKRKLLLNKREIKKLEKVTPVINDHVDDTDFQYARENLYNLIERGNDGLE